MQRILVSIFRKYKRKPVTSFINLIGLTLSLSLVIIMSAYCYTELTTDARQEKSKQTYLVCNNKEITTYGAITSGVLKKEIDIQVPSIKTSVRITGTWETPVFKVGNNEPIKSELIFADSTFFDIFTYLPVSGNLKNALTEPMSLVITRLEAIKLFGTDQVVGKTVLLNNTHLLTVTAVIDEPKENSCLSVKAIVPLNSLMSIQPNEGAFTNWTQRNYLTFVLVENKENVNETEKIINLVFPQDLRKDWETKLISLREIYFSDNGITSSAYYIKVGDKTKVMILLMVAIIILIIALINYSIISSSEFLERQKQKGIQKIFGASRFNIVSNIIIESSLTFLISILLALELVVFISHFIKNSTGIEFNTVLIFTPIFFALSILSAIILGGISSLFLAIRISSVSPIRNLKNDLSQVNERPRLRGVLVVFQFAAAICLIAFTILVQKQIKFATAEIGFDKENIVAIKITDQLKNKKDVFEKFLLEQPSVVKISYSQFYPVKDFRINYGWSSFTYKGEKKRVSVGSFSADANFLELLGIKLIKGRLFSADLATDRGKILVNETFIKESGIADPIGGLFSNQSGNYEIIGVIKDFHFKPVNEPIASLSIICDDAYASGFFKTYCLIKLPSNNSAMLRNFIQNTKNMCLTLSPDYPVEISFMDNAIKEMYQNETKFRLIFSVFSGSAIFICCLGILALSLLACQRRTKEIGIRKVHGAKIIEIIHLLNQNFLKWIAIAFVMACPIAWYFMNNWLEIYAYKTTISWWIFALSGLVAIIITLLTVLWQTLKVASKNPIEALRYE